MMRSHTRDIEFILGHLRVDTSSWIVVPAPGTTVAFAGFIYDCVKTSFATLMEAKDAAKSCPNYEYINLEVVTVRIFCATSVGELVKFGLDSTRFLDGLDTICCFARSGTFLRHIDAF